jgi:hypothetical protein
MKTVASSVVENKSTMPRVNSATPEGRIRDPALGINVPVIETGTLLTLLGTSPAGCDGTLDDRSDQLQPEVLPQPSQT